MYITVHMCMYLYTYIYIYMRMTCVHIVIYTLHAPHGIYLATRRTVDVNVRCIPHRSVMHAMQWCLRPVGIPHCTPHAHGSVPYAAQHPSHHRPHCIPNRTLQCIRIPYHEVPQITLGSGIMNRVPERIQLPAASPAAGPAPQRLFESL